MPESVQIRLWLREAGHMLQQGGRPPNVLLWNMTVTIVFKLVPRNLKKKKRFLLVENFKVDQTLKLYAQLVSS